MPFSSHSRTFVSRSCTVRRVTEIPISQGSHPSFLLLWIPGWSWIIFGLWRTLVTSVCAEFLLEPIDSAPPLGHCSFACFVVLRAWVSRFLEAFDLLRITSAFKSVCAFHFLGRNPRLENSRASLPVYVTLHAVGRTCRSWLKPHHQDS